MYIEAIRVTFFFLPQPINSMKIDTYSPPPPPYIYSIYIHAHGMELSLA